MTNPTERSALLALYRNHPATGPGDRYNWKARAESQRLRGTLLDWAAAQSDETLLHCRNLGPVALRWIREQENRPAFDYDPEYGWIVQSDGEGASQIVAKEVLPSFGRWVDDQRDRRR